MLGIMTTATASLPERMTSREFRAWAGARPEGERYELVAGEVVAMAPERASHNRIKFNIALSLRAAVLEAGLPCQTFTDGMAVEIDDETNYEPDAMVRCGEPVSDEATVVTDPMIVVEVVSPSSGGADSGGKLADYFKLPSVQHYVVVRPRKRSVVHHRRGGDGRIETTIVAGSTLELTPPGISVQIASFFD
jgi:Uma2 family endonuclease